MPTEDGKDFWIVFPYEGDLIDRVRNFFFVKQKIKLKLLRWLESNFKIRRKCFLKQLIQIARNAIQELKNKIPLVSKNINTNFLPPVPFADLELLKNQLKKKSAEAVIREITLTVETKQIALNRLYHDLKYVFLINFYNKKGERL